MKILNLIELNEVNFEIVKKYVSEHPGKFPGFEKLFNMESYKTTSEDVYEQIEPWIQWASVHTCQTYNQHQVFRLGDIVEYKGDQIFEKIENAGYQVGCVSPMNTNNKLENKPSKKNKTKERIGLYRVQFGSFRNKEKAMIAMDSMIKQHKILLSNVNLEIFTFENSKKFVFYRVWTSPVTKKNGLKLCDEFKLQNITCILQLNK